MVKIRLKRMGSKFNAFYRIVAADAKAPRDGRFIEELGYYNPNNKDLKIDKELAFKWLKNGAQLTETTRNLFTKKQILEEYEKIKNKK
ncbi:MAG: 30S ribosomal protein S16 [Mycoplasmataceae bacterium]|mgnify:CR=1 FL=1|nr:30S ribosomal protein S16 [Mycoplasmataceae bacterium]MBR2849346.1 30S ribosomal protein S16 [Mycoplasmataceae bacterium]MBR2999267.1 30S ribosomal protein S16 [Mycoplasmataceae bacterium]MBR3259311.1 30S ribosomal protein S16 [Mycoplasmataceae bacterium]MBR3348104.1 30S ribosomal protein S16 [Mycoplasmataceae bacterium]